MPSVRKRTKARKPVQVSKSQILIVVVVAFLATGVMILLNSDILRPESGMAGATRSYEVGVTADGNPYKGSPDAPLQMILYSDFLCSHCGHLATTLDEISSEFVDTGKLQIVFRSFAFLTPESILAAEASECALDQGADVFWRYHDLLYNSQGGGLAAYTPTALKGYAEQIGMDTTSFGECLDGGSKETAAQTDLDAGVSAGVQGTPTWFLNGQMVPGAVPVDDLRAILTEMLNQ